MGEGDRTLDRKKDSSHSTNPSPPFSTLFPPPQGTSHTLYIKEEEEQIKMGRHAFPPFDFLFSLYHIDLGDEKNNFVSWISGFHFVGRPQPERLSLGAAAAVQEERGGPMSGFPLSFRLYSLFFFVPPTQGFLHRFSAAASFSLRVGMRPMLFSQLRKVGQNRLI